MSMHSYTNIEDRPYYVYNLEINKVTKFSNINELKMWAANHQVWHIMGEINMNFKDIKVLDNNECRLRQFVVKDSLDRVIDLRAYVDDIQTIVDSLSAKIYRKTYKHSFKYRQEPVPLTGHWFKYCGFRYNMHTANEKRQNSDPEIQQFVRKARNVSNLPDPWDDIARHSERSWKHHKKIKKQYMKHWKKHTLNICSLKEKNKEIMRDYIEDNIEYPAA